MFALFIFLLVSLGLATLAELLGAVLYDVLDIRSKKQLIRHPGSKAARFKPSVTVIVYALNDAQTVEACLNSLISGRYRKYSAVVIDDGSQDQTAEKIRDYIKANPKKRISLVARRKTYGLVQAISLAAKKANGELTLCIAADARLEKDSMQNLVLPFSNTQTQAVAANLIIDAQKELNNVMRQFILLVRMRSLKLQSVIKTNISKPALGNVYRASSLKALLNKRKATNLASMFAADATLRISKPNYYGSQRFLGSVQTKAGRMINFAIASAHYGVVLAWLSVTAYFVYIAVQLQKPELYGLVWLILSLWVLIGIIQSNQPLRAKLRLVSFLPVMYIPLYFGAIFSLGDVVLRSVRNLAVRSQA